MTDESASRQGNRTDSVQRPRVAGGSLWRVQPGPVGRGTCLARDELDDAVVFIGPPGVPLELPEQLGTLMRWRTATWRYGERAGPLTVISVEDAIEMAPARRGWIELHLREDHREVLVSSDGAAAEPETRTAAGPEVNAESGVLPVSAAWAMLLPDRRRVAEVTQSASTFAWLVHALPADSGISTVERALAGSVSSSHFAAELEVLAFSIGATATRELTTSLLHARTRSHSWRFTWFLRVFERRGRVERLVAREALKAADGLDLLMRVAALDEETVDEALVNLLYMQSRGIRWTVTYPARRLLGVRHLQGIRGFLRRAQPRYARYRAKLAPRGLKVSPSR
jgi:hypothetical protein